MQDYSRVIIEGLIQNQLKLGITVTDQSNVLIEALGHGENNHMFKVTVGANHFVFRIPFRAELAPKLKQEFQTLQHIPTDIGPKALVFHEDQPTYMIQSLVKGIHPIDWTPELIKAHVAAMTKLHTSHKKPCQGIDMISLFEAKIDFRLQNDPEVMQDKTILALTHNLIDKIKKTQERFSQLKTLAFIHGDLHAGNILANGNAVHYVDWEEARYDDYALDVAGLLLSQSIDTELYFAAYQKATQPDSSLPRRVITWLLYKELSFLLHKKWESISPDTRTIHQSAQDYQAIITETVTRMQNRINLL